MTPWIEAIRAPAIARRLAWILPRLGRFTPEDFLLAALISFDALSAEGKHNELSEMLNHQLGDEFFYTNSTGDHKDFNTPKENS